MGFRTVIPEDQVSVETETRLLLPDGTVLGPGDITLEGGVGVAERVKSGGGGVVLDAAATATQHPLSFYRHGTLAGGIEIARFRITDPDNTTVLRELFANLGVAPVGTDVDGSNHIALRVRGTTSGQQDLPIDTADRYHDWSGTDAAEVGSCDVADTGNMTGLNILARLMEPTADLTATQLSFRVNGAGSQDGTREATLRLPDGTSGRPGTVVARSDPKSTSVAGRDWDAFSLPTSYDWAQGQRLWVCCEDTGGSGGLDRADGAETVSGTFANLGATNPGVGFSFGNDFDALTDTTWDTDYIGVRVSGTPGGVSIVGTHCIIELITVGAPGPGVGDNLNVALALAESAE